MTLHPRFRFSLMGLACACAALAASSFAHSQSPAPATSQGQAAQPTPQAPADAGLGVWFNAEQRRTEYSGFLQLVGSGDPFSRPDWAKILNIREDEEQTMRTIATDAWRRIKEINDRDYASAMERSQNPSAENVEKFLALNKELGRQRKEILNETIVRLRQELGEEDFKKLDDYIYKRSTAGMAATAAKRRENAPDPQQSGSGSDSAPAKEPQL